MKASISSRHDVPFQYYDQFPRQKLTLRWPQWSEWTALDISAALTHSLEMGQLEKREKLILFIEDRLET